MGTTYNVPSWYKNNPNYKERFRTGKLIDSMPISINLDNEKIDDDNIALTGYFLAIKN